MSQQLPVKLGRSPLVDSIFEIRFEGENSLSSILTGIVFSSFKCSKIEKLGPAELPEFVRMNDPNLAHAILQRLTWGNYFIGIGDRVVTLAAEPPYRGWTDFKDKILEVLNFLEQQAYIRSIQRFSLKYIDVLPDDIHSDIFATLNIKFSLGNNNPDPSTIYMRAEIPFESGTHILQVVGQATARIPKLGERRGILVDIDSIYNLNTTSPAQAVGIARDRLDKLHDSTKALFFDLLTPDGLARMDPTYE